ncbi:hypothetical protein PISMIDRAFT_678761 [Pisolithus microcarpus 441]|uniref:Unplaced genomic scaffold scaffold_38, whole genome shotgun sequence n=1 Tax=Pisolithus microcarpus 441 TaxID=765257 RepID=A0A0C9YFW3_9AGAM|nr:hypothetical protein PISMIDRAFT_678761 [Pisolithus microcarpus 441]
MAPTVPGTVELEEATVAMLRKACKDGVVNDLTVRMVRQELEQQFSLAPGTLDANEHKSTIKATVLTNLDEIRASMAARQSQELAAKKKPDHTVSPSKKRGSDRKEQKGASKRMRKARVVESSAEESETEARNERKSRDAPSGFPKKSRLPAKLEINGSKPVVENNSKLKSKAIIDTSEDEPAEKPTSSRTPKEKKLVQTTPTKPTNKPPSNVTSHVELKRSGNPAPSSSKIDTVSKPQSSPPKARAVVDNDDEGSELSSVVDEPPKKQRKKQGESDSRTSKRGKKSKEPLPKDEATVSKLKAIIVACGLRKVWKKEFQGLERPKQQIKRLHEMLAELGMTPRYTMEKAREIRKKREFERELQDVKEFEEALRERDRKKQASASGSDSDEPTNSDGVPVKKKKTARASIMAFLEDQSDEE